MARFSVKTDASERLQDIFTKNMRIRIALYDVRQTTLAEALQITQATLSSKLNRRTEWTIADIANAAVFFQEPAENLITTSALDVINAGSNYQVEHNVPPDNSRRELAGAAGSARFFVEPEDEKKKGTAGGNARPRFFIEQVPLVGLEPTLRRF